MGSRHDKRNISFNFSPKKNPFALKLLYPHRFIKLVNQKREFLVSANIIIMEPVKKLETC